jgi:hypothetical protein
VYGALLRRADHSKIDCAEFARHAGRYAHPLNIGS